MQKTKKTKIVLTGGHAGSTAYAVIESLRENRNYLWDIYWIGSKKAIEGSGATTFEHKVFIKIGIPFYSLNAGKLQTKFTFWTIPSLFKIPVGFIQALFYLVKLKPKVIVSFGGYAALPVVVGAYLLRIPVIIHEQTAAAGRSNEIGSRFASKILLARASSLKYFPKEKCLVIGSPISREIQSIKPKKAIGKVPAILVTGGSRGSLLINNCLKQILTKLIQKYKVIHQTGEAGFEEFLNIKKNLSEKLSSRYKVVSFMGPWVWKKLVGQADIIVGRAGANTVWEIVYIKRPSILIPLRIAYRDEQLENAKFARDFGIAKIIEENDLSADRLLTEIESVTADWEGISAKVKDKKSPDENSVERFINIIESYI